MSEDLLPVGNEEEASLDFWRVTLLVTGLTVLRGVGEGWDFRGGIDESKGEQMMGRGYKDTLL